jgi:hypothetical protein
LIVLRKPEFINFSHVATGDESWFSYRYKSTHCYAKSREEVPPRTEIIIATKRAKVTLFFTGTKRLIVYILRLKKKFNQNHFLTSIAPELSKDNSNSKRTVGKKELIVHMDNSMCHNGRKVQEYFAIKR